MDQSSSMFGYMRQDSIAGLVVFLVAVPLCLGIAIACGVPPISGLVAGIAGGLIVPWISRSPLSVSGPAAGLTSVVLAEVSALGGLEPFLTAVIIAGFVQTGLGVLRAGRFAALVPSAVIKGMLAAIGIIIIMKQLPVLVGLNDDLTDMLGAGIPSHFTPGAALVGALSLAILYGWKLTPLGKYKLISPALVTVVVASLVALAISGNPGLALTADQYVSIPTGGATALFAALPRPDFGALAIPATWVAGVTIAVVASIETLLSLQAVDRLDPYKRHSPPNRELLAQGAANAVSGFFGGLPITAVIVRSGANVAAGARERFSSLFHGILLVMSVLFAAEFMNKIPLACLAAVLIQVGFNLAKPALFKAQVKLGLTQAAPFIITIAAVLALDLLKGVIIGIVVGVGFILFQNSRKAVVIGKDTNGVWQMRFRRDGTFLSKPTIVSAFDEVRNGDEVVVDGSGEYIDHDIKEVIATFLEDARNRNIKVSLIGIDLAGATAGGGH